MSTGASIEHFGGYESVELLGSGGFADVYRCYHHDLDSFVAVKVLHPHLARQEEVRRRFIAEAQILWRADNPRLIPVFHVDSLSTGQPYFVMRLAEKGSLASQFADQMALGTPFELRNVVGFGVELSDCIDALRANDVVHRDLKPANVLVRLVKTPDMDRARRWGLPPDERLVLADFGLAKTLSGGSSLLSQIGGTPWYMAPELASLTAHVDWRADLFVVAVILYELATGTVPWPERTLVDVREVDVGRVMSAELSGGTIPPAFDDVIRRAVMPDPAERFESPADLADALIRLVPDDPEDAESRSEPLRIRVRGLARRAGERTEADVVRVLDQPRRLTVVGGERTTPEGLSLRLLGRRTEPGGGSMLGHCVTRIRHAAESTLTAVTKQGARVDGRIGQDANGFLRLEVGCAPWSVAGLELEVPGNHLGDAELVDLPWSVLRGDPASAAVVLRETDLVIMGLPTAGGLGLSTLETVVSLLWAQTGPVGIVGVQAAAAWEQTPEHLPGTLAVMSSDDAAELRALIDDVIGGERRDLLHVSAAIALLDEDASVQGDPDLSGALGDLLETSPELAALQAARLAVAHRAGLSLDERDEAVSLLARRAPQCRLRLSSATDDDELQAAADDRLTRWVGILTLSETGSNRRKLAGAAIDQLERLRAGWETSA